MSYTPRHRRRPSITNRALTVLAYFTLMLAIGTAAGIAILAAVLEPIA